MLKQDEKIVFSIESGFSLKGLEEFNTEEKCLQFTNLGNIIISKVDYLEKEYIKYSFSEYEIPLDARINGGCIEVIAKELPVEYIRNDVVRKQVVDMVFILDLNEFSIIENRTNKEIFHFENNVVSMILGNNIVKIGRIRNDIDRIIFEDDCDKEYEFLLKDIEYCSEKYGRIEIEGYFLLGCEEVYRRVIFVGDLSLYSLPAGIETIISSNKKIDIIPLRDEIFLCEISGEINKKVYNSRNMFIVINENNIKIYDGYNRDMVLENNIKDISKYKLDNGSYIIYDELNVYRLRLGEKAVNKMRVDHLRSIMNPRIGYSKNKIPFFIDFDEEYIYIKTSSNKTVFNIKKKEISDIKVHEELNIENGDMVCTEIRYADKKININLKRILIEELTENIFSQYQLSLLKKSTVEEVYYNWIKSVSDTVIYNLYREIYIMYLDLLKLNTDKYTIDDWLIFSNKYYKEIDCIVDNYDRISISLCKILEKNEYNYFRGINRDYNGGAFNILEKKLDDIRNSLRREIIDSKREIRICSDIIMPFNHIAKFSSDISLKEEERLIYISEMYYRKISHLLTDLLPYYIEKTVVSVFDVYNNLYNNYKDIDEDELKLELMNRIKSIHIFKQFSDCGFKGDKNISDFENIDKDSNDETILRKDIIEDMYMLIKFYDMRIDSEYYYTGLYT